MQGRTPRVQQRAGAGPGPPVQLPGRPQRHVGVRDPGPRQDRARRVRVQSLQVPQPQGGPDRGRDRRQGLVQGEFIGAAGTREEPQAPHERHGRQQDGRSLPVLVGQRQLQGPLADQVVAGAGVRAALGGQRTDRPARHAPRQGPLHQPVRGEDLAVAAHRRGRTR
ncbi:hypothetical protein O1L44_25230 [Streptomyces noursei]|nr:hypothetical protein [Streptomyces noursei]